MGKNEKIEAVVLGSSAGAVEALMVILPGLPRRFRLPLMVVVHMPAAAQSGMAELFRSKCQLAVKEAEDKEPIQESTIYFAPPNYHLLVEIDRRMSLSSEEPVLYSRPSIDVLFETAADAYGTGLAGIVLTGANSDGACGLRAVCESGGVGIVQKPELAQEPTMPQAALQACPGALVLSLSEILGFLRNLDGAVQS
jgi:two-component system, chemotaxis family, protein-glutamate methylesterase/glutaminase